MTTIAPARRILPAFARYGKGISEFVYDPQTKTTLNGTCTQTALACCVAAVEGRDPSSADVLRYVQQMRALKDAAGNPLAAENGAATLIHTAWYAAHVLGKHIALEWDYQEPLQGDWLDELRNLAGINPILMQVAHGANLIDAETGVRPEAAARGLRYHAIAIIGKQADGYCVCDGDNPQVASRFQIYTRQTLEAAVPCGLLILSMPPAPAPTPAPPPVVHAPPDPAAPYRAVLQQIEALAGAALRG